MKERRRKLGFTLVEVMVSMMILTASSIIFFALLPMSFKTGKMVGCYQQASSLVQHKIDQMRGVGYGRLNYTELANAGIIDASPTSAPFSFKGVDGLDSIYVGPVATIQISDFSANVKQVTVSLVWSGSAMKQGQGDMTVTALIAKG